MYTLYRWKITFISTIAPYTMYLGHFFLQIWNIKKSCPLEG
jgi:hypothetical protein